MMMILILIVMMVMMIMPFCFFCVEHLRVICYPQTRKLMLPWERVSHGTQGKIKGPRSLGKGCESAKGEGDDGESWIQPPRAGRS